MYACVHVCMHAYVYMFFSQTRNNELPRCTSCWNNNQLVLCKLGSDMLPVGTGACMRDETGFVLYLSGVFLYTRKREETGKGRRVEGRRERFEFEVSWSLKMCSLPSQFLF